MQHQEWLEASEGVRVFLVQQGIPENSTIALRNMAPKTLIAWFWGIARHRCTAVLLSDRDPDDVISARCAQVGAKYVFSHLPPPAIPTKRHPVDEHRIAAILFTSGSTNTPKAVAHSLQTLKSSALASNKNIALADQDRWLLSLSLWHIGGLAIMFRTLYAGAQLIYPNRMYSLGEQIRNHRITHLSVVATQLYRLLQENDIDLSSLKAILVGGGPIPSRLIDVSHHLPIHSTYGMTELGSQLCTTPPNSKLRIRKTAGRPLKGWEIKIDSNNQIWARGPALFLGYIQHQKPILPQDEQGFFATGDTGKIDNNGCLVVLGRCDQMFISGGENIHPEEIEGHLCAHPKVEAALVLAIEDAEYGKRPVAFVKGNVTQQSLSHLLQQTLPKYKHPDAYFAWPKDLPTQKPSRKQARKYLLHAISLP